jgi:ankyrin repeat protein
MPDLVQLLLERGADLNLTDQSGGGPLHASADPDTLDLLLRAGADPTARSKEGYTPLHLIGDKASAQLLVEAGADPHAHVDAGGTPADMAELILNRAKDLPSVDLRRIEAGEEAVAYLRSLVAGDALEESTPAVGLTQAEGAAEAQIRRL